MSYLLEELNPSCPILQIDGKEIKLSLITLHKEVAFAEKYGSFQDVFEHLRKKPEDILEVMFELLEDKTQFKNSPEVFKKFIFSITSKEKIEEKSTKMFEALQDATSKSMPLIKNMKRHKEIQQINSAGEETKPCYVVYYDALAKRYGYTIEQFYSLTLRQVHLLLKVIGDKTYEELEIQAALQGKKLKPRMNFDDISPEQEAANEEQAFEALRELQKKYQDKKAEQEK